MEREYSVTELLPDNGQKCMCFGYHTYCCHIDMDEVPDWHEVTFSYEVSSYKLKKTIPDDPEESILEEYEVKEFWFCGSDSYYEGMIVGVTKWKYKDK